MSRERTPTLTREAAYMGSRRRHAAGCIVTCADLRLAPCPTGTVGYRMLLFRERVTCWFPGSSEIAHGMLLQVGTRGTPRSGDAPRHAGSIILWCEAVLSRAAHQGMI